jgi:hypothetical protein
MTHRRVIARLKATPNMSVGPQSETVTLEQVGSTYQLVVTERGWHIEKPVRRRIPLSEAEVSARMRDLRGATIPALPFSELVCDGEQLELTINGDGSSVTLCWTSIPPCGAEAVAAFADWLRGLGTKGS